MCYLLIATCGKTVQLQPADCWLEYIEYLKIKNLVHAFLFLLILFVYISRGSGYKVFILCLCQFKTVGRLYNSFFNLHICMPLPEEPSFYSPVADSCYFVGKFHSTKGNLTRSIKCHGLQPLMVPLEPFILMVNYIKNYCTLVSLTVV